MLHVIQNEQTDRVKFVHVYKDASEIPPRLASDVAFLDKVYPDIDMDLVPIEGEFSPEIIDSLSKK